MPGLREPKGSHERRRLDVREVGTAAFSHRSYPMNTVSKMIKTLSCIATNGLHFGFVPPE